MVQRRVTVGEPGTLAYGERNCFAGHGLQSLKLPESQAQCVDLPTACLHDVVIHDGTSPIETVRALTSSKSLTTPRSWSPCTPCPRSSPASSRGRRKVGRRS